MENASPTSSMELLPISDLCVRDRAEPYMNPISPDRESYSLGIYKSPVAPQDLSDRSRCFRARRGPRFLIALRRGHFEIPLDHAKRCRAISGTVEA